MRLVSSVCMIGIGMVTGVILVLSCGSDSPRRVDAADAPICNCPASEPPLKSRITEVTDALTVPANGVMQIQSSVCPFGAIVLNGGCTANGGQPANIILEQSAPEGNGWFCSWRNPSNADIRANVVLHCLVPAP